MKSSRWTTGMALSFFAAIAIVAAGCGQSKSGGSSAKQPSAGATKVAADDSATWWCKEHGVPESQCGQCRPALTAEFKKKGEWCKEHDAPESQCFTCHPELEAKFAALYEAKYGKRPPQREKEN